MSQRAVSRILSAFAAFAPCGTTASLGATIIPLALSSLTGSSDRPGGFRRAACGTPPYLVLLRAGFCLPPVLPRARCALTAPFHPYSPPRLLRAATAEQALGPATPKAGGIFSVPLSFELPRPGVTRRTALRSSDFPPTSARNDYRRCELRWTSSLRNLSTEARSAKVDDRLAHCDKTILQRAQSLKFEV